VLDPLVPSGQAVFLPTVKEISKALGLDWDDKADWDDSLHMTRPVALAVDELYWVWITQRQVSNGTLHLRVPMCLWDFNTPKRYYLDHPADCVAFWELVTAWTLAQGDEKEELSVRPASVLPGIQANETFYGTNCFTKLRGQTSWDPSHLKHLEAMRARVAKSVWCPTLSPALARATEGYIVKRSRVEQLASFVEWMSNNQKPELCICCIDRVTQKLNFARGGARERPVPFTVHERVRFVRRAWRYVFSAIMDIYGPQPNPPAGF
jgi:hypothetical protein